MPLVLLAFPILFNLVVLRAELRTASNPNDAALHVQMIKWAAQSIDEGRVPTDGWYAELGLGSPHFRQYHSTPHQITGALARVTGADRAMRWTLYMLLALWPLSVFWGARLLGWGRWAAGAAALVSPLVVSAPGYGFEHSSYVWRGFGLWTQAWAMWTLPVALGLGWRAVSRGRGYAAAAAATGVTIAFHMIAGYLVLVAIGVWVLARRGEWIRRTGRGLLLGAGSLAVAAWVLVPLLLDAGWVNRSAYARGTFWTDSFGARRVLGWLVAGDLLDAGRFPVVTLLAAVGLGVCIARFRTEPARAVTGLFVVSLALFFGRPTLGPLLRLLPGSGDLQLHRFVFGVQLAGIMLAGAGIAWLATAATSLVRGFTARRLPPAVAAAAAVAVLLPGWAQIGAYHREGAGWIAAQRSADATDGADVVALIDAATVRGDGRVYAGMRSGWGSGYRIGSVPVYSLLMERRADAVGYTLRVGSLSTDFEALFDEHNLAHYELFNVRYVIMPSDQPPPVPATLLEGRGRHRLWSVETSGYVSLVDTTDAVAADRSSLVERLGWFLNAPAVREGLHPAVAFGGRRAAPPTDRGGTLAPRGIAETLHSSGGTYVARVEAARPSIAMLKASFHPGWQAFVDGRRVPAQMIAPSFVGVRVPAGRHVVVFRYRGFRFAPALLALGVLTLVGLSALSRRSSRQPARTLPAPATDPDEGEVDLTIVIPAYNEASRIGATLRRVLEAAPGAEVIVVDDGSTDQTAAVAEAFGGVAVVRLETNAGKGAAVRRGVAASHGRTVVFMDADLSTDLEALPRLLDGLRDADVAVGSRGLAASVVSGDSRVRSRLGRTFAQLQRIVMRMKIADSQCGFKAFRGAVARQVFALGTVDRFAFDAEILYLAQRIGYRIVEVPVRWRAAPGSKVRAIRDSLLMLRDLLAIRLRWPAEASPAAPARSDRVARETVGASS